MRISVIGAGNMGGALAKGWVKAMRDGADLDITVTARTQQSLDRIKADFPELHCTLDNKTAVAEAEIVVLAVKPWMAKNVIDEIASEGRLDGKIFISVAANILPEDLKAMLPGSTAQILYVMPNIAAEYCQSMTFISPADDVPAETVKTVERLLSLLGKTQVCDLKTLAAGNMLAGCGIAYVMRFIHAMMQGGVELGLYPANAQQIAQQTMTGAVAVLQESGLHPEAAIDKVTTPGGLTIRGLNELEHSGMTSAVIRCLKAGMK